MNPHRKQSEVMIENGPRWFVPVTLPPLAGESAVLMVAIGY
jgi:hypothetical protein